MTTPIRTRPSRPRRRRALAVAAAVAAAAAAIDQGSKLWALEHASQTERLPLLGNLLGLQLAFNPGTVMSFGSDSTWIFTLISATASIAFIAVAYRAKSPAWAVAIGFVWGGAVGNLIDRLFAPPAFGQGHVVDFLAYGSLFIGNLADVAIGVGAILAVILTLRGSSQQRLTEPASPQPASQPHQERNQ